jgi:hypothetical protein
MTTSLRATAVRMTLAGLPAPLSRSAKAFSAGLRRCAVSAAMYNTARTSARPPATRRRPLSSSFRCKSEIRRKSARGWSAAHFGRFIGVLRGG